MAFDIEKELAALRRLSVGGLRDRYAEVFGEPTNGNNKPWLIRRIAWRLQERAEGGLSDRAKARAAELADEADLRTGPPRPGNQATARSKPVPMQSDRRLPPPGTILTRPYKGKTIEVRVRADGFEYRGEVYGSLSAVAKAATGSHCNGFAFFGLTGQGGKR